jgi:hypothetical protein
MVETPPCDGPIAEDSLYLIGEKLLSLPIVHESSR